MLSTRLTPGRCNTVELPERPARSFGTASPLKGGAGTAAKVVGMVKIRGIGIIGSQVLRAAMPMDAVHRLSGGGSRHC